MTYIDTKHDALHDPEPCDHGITFDLREAKAYTIGEVRHKFPRLDGKCPKDCGFEGIGYASMAHFIYGDW